MSVSLIERCNGNVGSVNWLCKGWTAVSTLRDDLILILLSV